MIRVELSLLAVSLVGSPLASHAQQQPVEHAGRPVVSPDGRHIVFASRRDGAPELYVMGADGSGVVRLTNTAEGKGVAGWSADGSRVVYNVVKGDSATLYSISLEGGTPARAGVARGQGARVTRDGTRVVYGVMPWQTMQLFVASTDGSNPRRITPGASAFYCSALSPDDKQVATSRSDSASLQIWLFALDGSSSRQLTHFTPEQGHAQCPAWSPDGRRLAIQSDVFDRENPRNETSHIWVIDVATGEATKLAAHAQPYRDELPVWFPDGRRIAFQSDRTGRWEVWVMNADGSDARQLTR